jgi:hypothetical protein
MIRNPARAGIGSRQRRSPTLAEQYGVDHHKGSLPLYDRQAQPVAQKEHYRKYARRRTGSTGHPFLGGHVDYQYGVLLLEGKLHVSNSAGSEDISVPNHGIDFPPILKKGPAISPAYEWPPEKIARALAQTSFGVAFNPGVLVPGLIPVIPGIIDPDDEPASP